MAQVVLRSAATSSHARTARLVAAAVARRIDLGEDRTEVVRQAVGEAYAYLLGRTSDLPGASIELIVDDHPAPEPLSASSGGQAADGAPRWSGDECLVVRVRAAGGAVSATTGERARSDVPSRVPARSSRAPQGVDEADLAMAILTDLTDTLDVVPGGDGLPALRLGWSTVR